MRKLLALMLSLLMLMGVAPVSLAEEPFVITVLCPYYGDKEPAGATGEEGNPVLEAVEKLCNVDLQITWAPQGDYVTKFNTVMASNDQPMVLVIASGVTTNANYIQMSYDGAFWDLTDKIKERDIFVKELTSPGCLAISSVGGRNYLFPAVVSSARLGVIYRQDWLEKLNLAIPANVETFKKMAEAFTTQDPDGNGVKDTIGFAYCDNQDKELTYAGFNTLACALGAPNYWGVHASADLMPYFFFDEYMETLELFNWMYVNGFMNTDFAINTDKHGPLTNGVAGSMITTATNARFPGGKYDNVRNVHPDAKIAVQQILYKEDGAPVLNSTLSYGGVGGVLIPKYSVKDEATVDRILDFFEMFNDEGGILTAVGVEGVHYTRQADGKLSISEEQKKARVDDGSSEVFASMFPRRVQSLDYGQGMTAVQEITAVSISNEPYVVNDLSIPYMSDEMRTLQTEIANIISDARVKFISGLIDAAGFKTAVDNWLAAGGQQIIDGVNAAYHGK